MLLVEINALIVHFKCLNLLYRMNLIYMCIFHQESYIELLKLLVTTISVNANLNKETTDILIITNSSYKPLIQKEMEEFDFSIKY